MCWTQVTGAPCTLSEQDQEGWLCPMLSPPLAAESRALTPTLCYSEFSQHCALHCSHWHCGINGNDVCGASLQKEIFSLFFFFWLALLKAGLCPHCRAGAAKASAASSPRPQAPASPQLAVGIQGTQWQQHRVRFSVSSSPAAREGLLWAELSFPLDQAVMYLALPFGFP